MFRKKRQLNGLRNTNPFVAHKPVWLVSNMISALFAPLIFGVLPFSVFAFWLWVGPSDQNQKQAYRSHVVLIDSSDPITLSQKEQIQMLTDQFLEESMNGDKIVVAMLTHNIQE